MREDGAAQVAGTPVTPGSDRPSGDRATQRLEAAWRTYERAASRAASRDDPQLLRARVDLFLALEQAGEPLPDVLQGQLQRDAWRVVDRAD